MPANADPLIPAPGSVAVRLYGQGLGDCFLLAFPRTEPGAPPCYMVIDCGVGAATPGGGERMRQIVSAIHRATGGVIDVLAVTHQHFDHISGFLQAREEWEKLTVKALYLPWTEAANEREEAKTISKLREALNRAAEEAVLRAAESGTLDAHPALRAEASFLGIDAAGATPAAAFAANGRGDMDEAMQLARGLPPDVPLYFQPGDVFRLPGTECHGYVLGPPLPTTQGDAEKPLVELLVDDDHMYSYAQFPGMKVDGGHPPGGGGHALFLNAPGMAALASGLAMGAGIADASARADDEVFCPFDSSVRIEWEQAMALDFFQEHYGDAEERGEHGAWRRVDNDWLGGAATLALRADGFTNNISLVLAFDVPGSRKMLLFPGDAQVGNWLSWHEISRWTMVGDARPHDPPGPTDDQTLMENLLGRVAFYKVGHHGSHNATIRQLGLELMTHPDLVAYVPVSVPVAQDLMGYCPMPFYPVVRRLQEKTQGRVFLANGLPVGPLPEGKTEADFLAAAGMEWSTETLPPKLQDGVTLEPAVPLYVELEVGG